MEMFESQLDARSRLDDEALERAYAMLASSVTDRPLVPVFDVDDPSNLDAAIKACLAYWGVISGTAPEGETDAEKRIEHLCRPSGTMHRLVRLEGEWQRSAFGPMLGQLDTGETIALLPHGVRGYVYTDPATGKKVEVTTKVAAHICEDAIMFYKPLPMRSCDIWDLTTFIFGTFDRNDYMLIVFASIFSTVIGLIPAQVNKLAFGTVVPSQNEGMVLPLVCLLLGVAVSTTLVKAFMSLVVERVSTKLDLMAEAAAFSRMLTLPSSFFKEYASGDLGSRVSGVTTLVRSISSILLSTGLSLVLSLAYVVQIWAFAPALVVPALLVIVIQAVLTILSTLATIRYAQMSMEASNKLSGTVTALLNGIQKIKLAGAEDRAFARWARGYANYARSQYNTPTIVRALPALSGLVSLLGGVVIYFMAGSSGTNVDDYMAFNVAYGQVAGAIMAVVGMTGQIARIRPMMKQVEPLLMAVPEATEDKPAVENLSGGIGVSGVSFRYSESSPYVLEDLTFSVRPGEYVALVGRSGCGKSTILRLLLGLEKPERGSILYGTYDVERVDLRSLRSHIGVVMQDGKLFMGNVFSNITISAPTATLEDAWHAAEIAGVANDIREMPMGMHTIISEGGGGVSGGQRQRLMIARAVCGNRRILMLDEATSALDNKTQKHVIDSLDTLKCTRLVVAHRLSTVRHCDRILVIDGGRVAEQGTYEELIARGGLFAQLVARQRLDA